jgi:hypothetical protein
MMYEKNDRKDCSDENQSQSFIYRQEFFPSDPPALLNSVWLYSVAYVRTLQSMAGILLSTELNNYFMSLYLKVLLHSRTAIYLTYRR